MENITLVGIDIAKTIFQIHAVDKRGKAIMRRKLKRTELLSFVSNLPKCTIAMEACGGSNFWARQFQSYGHEVKLISPQFVKPFVKTNKNDAHDAQAITEAASRPEMRFVPIKHVEQQDIQCVHRIRQRLITKRTALVNQIRGLLAEYGIIIPEGMAQVRKKLLEIIGNMNNELTSLTRDLFSELYDEFLALQKRIDMYEKRIRHIFENNPICQKLKAIEGIGPISATILITALSDPKLFKNGRHFAAFLGLVPKQCSSGGREKLLGISKRGDTYLRSLLIHGARAVLNYADKKADGRSRWLKQLKERRGFNKACVALANKNARVVWALVANNTYYQKVH